MIPVQVVGLGMSPADLTPKAREIIREAQVLVGGRRLLDYFPEHRSMKIPLGKDPEGTLKQLPALAETKRVVVLASGDPNFYGVGPLVVQGPGGGAGGDPPQPHRGPDRLRPAPDALAGRHRHQPPRPRLGTIDRGPG